MSTFDQGALSMADVMTKMADTTQRDLQAVERGLCSDLNMLASRIVAQAGEAPSASRSVESPACWTCSAP